MLRRALPFFLLSSLSASNRCGGGASEVVRLIQDERKARCDECTFAMPTKYEACKAAAEELAIDFVDATDYAMEGDYGVSGPPTCGVNRASECRVIFNAKGTVSSYWGVRGNTENWHGVCVQRPSCYEDGRLIPVIVSGAVAACALLCCLCRCIYQIFVGIPQKARERRRAATVTPASSNRRKLGKPGNARRV